MPVACDINTQHVKTEEYSALSKLSKIYLFLFSGVMQSCACVCVCVFSTQGHVKGFQLWVISKRDNVPYPLIGQ